MKYTVVLYEQGEPSDTTSYDNLDDAIYDAMDLESYNRSYDPHDVWQ